jgi:exodeoxyribonuclease VII large subunit
MAEVELVAQDSMERGDKAIQYLADLVKAYDPVHILRRGFSITLNARGKAVKCAGDVAPGETITTRLAAGEVASTVTQTISKEKDA